MYWLDRGFVSAQEGEGKEIILNIKWLLDNDFRKTAGVLR